MAGGISMNMDLTAEKMMGFLYELPTQFEESLRMNFDFVPDYQKAYRNILVTGLGGSAIGGDIVRCYAQNKARIPVIVNRDYDIPSFVNKDTLVLAVSYSGNTEETLSAYLQARAKGASIICVTSGGKLAAEASNHGYGIVRVPAGLVPRAATGYLFAPMALLLEKMGILLGVQAELEETVEVLKQRRELLNPRVTMPENAARMIAEEMKDAIPVIWGSTGLSEVAALRWKAQINENAKSPAYYNVFPELNHNEIVGFEVPEELLAQMVIVILKDENNNERIKKRMEVTSGLIKDKVKNVIEVNSIGTSSLARFYSLVYTGDYTSAYLALEYGINPTPVPVIDYLKAELAKS